MKKKLISGIIICTLIISSVLYPPAVYSAETEYASTFAELQTALSSVDNNGVIIITSSFEITSSLTVPAGKSITIKGADSSIVLSRRLNFAYTFFWVNDTTSLEVQSIILDGKKDTTESYESLIIVNKGTCILGSGAVLRNNDCMTFFYGGGISALNSGTIYMSGDALITGNEAARGGGVQLSYSSMIMNGGSISSNTRNASPNNYGGGIFVGSSSSLEINSGSITSNEADTGGGIFANVNSAVIMNGGSVTSNEAFTGGGISVNSSSSLEINSGSVTSNTADNGGGIYINSSASMIMNGGSITSNTADNGGGIYINDEASMILDSGIISLNEGTHGGGIYVNDGSSLTMNDGSITSNESTQGGGIYINDEASMILDGGIISLNESTYGGGIYINYSASLKMNSGSITLNTADNTGGGIYIDNGSSVIMDGGSITSNTADAGGGVFVIEAGSLLTMNGGSITSNTAIAAGGVGIGNEARMAMKGGSITNNTADMFGGGVAVTSEGSLTISGDSLISENTASGQGGGIYLEESSSLEMKGGSIVSNSAAEGGGIYIGQSSDVPAASVELSGGGIHLNSSHDIYQHEEAELLSFALSSECPHCGLIYRGLFTDPAYTAQLTSPASVTMELYAKYIKDADSSLNTIEVPESAEAGKSFMVSGNGAGPDSGGSLSVGDTQYVSVSVQMGSRLPVPMTSSGRTSSVSLSEETPGEYAITVIFQKQEWNGTEWVSLQGETYTVTSSITITPSESVTAPSVSGLKTVSLTEGYTSAVVKYTVSGAPQLELSVSGISGAETDQDGTLRLPDGLAAGEYKLIITAANGVNPEVIYEVTVIVTGRDTAEAASPKTGDSSSIFLWMMICAAALAACVLLRRRSRVF